MLQVFETPKPLIYVRHGGVSKLTDGVEKPLGGDRFPRESPPFSTTSVLCAFVGWSATNPPVRGEDTIRALSTLTTSGPRDLALEIMLLEIKQYPSVEIFHALALKLADRRIVIEASSRIHLDDVPMLRRLELGQIVTD